MTNYAQIDGQALIGASVGLLAAGGSVATESWSMTMLGLPLSTILAAFSGAFISLTFIAWPGCIRAASTIAAGTGVGAYLAPLAEHAFAIPVVLEKGVAFGLGLTVQVAVPALLAWIKKRGEA